MPLYLGGGDGSCWIVDGSATGLVVLAITRPPTLVEYSQDSYALFSASVGRRRLSAGAMSCRRQLLRFLDVLGNHVMGFDGELGSYVTYLDYLDGRRSEGQICMGSIYMAYAYSRY